MVSKWRLIEAELWGTHEEVHVEPGLELRRVVGAFGTLYELEITSEGALARTSTVLAEYLPPGVEHVPFEGVPEEDEEHDGVIVVHYWKDKGTG
ncbi:hypothetical protein AB0392_11390 [Nonomuraea angiospora]|uniref:hypothetical protein n=1 Tax=Nonomuraea angiospora TaxID=46172 RepID=UPI00344C9D7C